MSCGQLMELIVVIILVLEPVLILMGIARLRHRPPDGVRCRNGDLRMLFSEVGRPQ
jgi:hypothetical protein